ncbi:hypothetical protein D0869_13386 [Hortaea werneckii]|uniref:NAD-dependent epimerase/dehydratase domain-containing protein n=1 Tax=Hortaea werneckii TaxID=91943 RepID=A0A3M6Y931_HORWE|nr:UDP-glucose 4-epimerase [Hortaea werneckii]KAI7581153.1 UDP-glucose 4-epimerase [Hortaea werneckii]RMX73650.1 hypothetical protein D0869_13386 [Hortaea werneckii]RMX99547.1 hypothetical protein D0868_09485 [Hortaea werneckii]
MPGISSCNPALTSAGLDFRQETAFWDHDFDCLPPDDGKSYIMVLGGLGYIGSHTVLELLQEGFNVVVVDDLSNSFKTVLSRITTLAQAHCRLTGLIMPALRFHKMDYRSHAMNDMLARYSASRSRISAVIHFAAFKSVSESIAQPLAYYRNNVCGLVDLLATLQQHGIRNFVFSSSATVYGAKANSGEPLHEEDLVHMDEVQTDVDGAEILHLNGANGLISPYGRSKYFSEAILADLARADPSMRITALRYFNPVGCHPSGILREDPRQIPTNLFPVVASVMQGKKDTLEIFGTDWNTRDGTAIRDFIHVVDLARGHVAALTAAASDSKREPFRAYNLGTGKGMTVAEVLASFEEASKQQIPAVRAPRRAGDVGSCVAVVDRAERELDWRAVKSVGDCARDCWNALKLPDGIEY